MDDVLSSVLRTVVLIVVKPLDVQLAGVGAGVAPACDSSAEVGLRLLVEVVAEEADGARAGW